jgi:uncharacterized membrane protein
MLLVVVGFLKRKWNIRETIFAFENPVYYLILAILLYNALVIPFVLYNYCSFNIGFPEDLSYYAQSIFNTLSGHPLMATIFGYPPFDWNIVLIDHFTPIFVFLAPIYYFCQDAGFLLALQVIVVSLGAIPVYLISVNKMESKWMALFIAVIYMLFPVFTSSYVYGLRPDYFAMFFLLWAVWSMEKKNRWLLVFFIFLVLLCKENVFITVFLLSLYMVFNKTTRRLRACGVFFCIFTAIAGVLIWRTLKINAMQYDPGGNSAYAINQLGSLLEHYSPDSLSVAIEASMSNLFSIVRKLGYISLFSPIILLISGTFLENFVGCYIKGAQYVTDWHWHNIMFMPFVFVAYIFGMKKILVLGNKYFSKRKIARSIFFAWSIGVPLFTGLFDFNKNVIVPFAEHDMACAYMPKYYKSFLEVAQHIPAKGNLFTNYRMSPNVSNRKGLYVYPIAFSRPIDYFLFSNTFQGTQDEGAYNVLFQYGDFEEYYRSDDFILYVKKKYLAKEFGPAFDFSLSQTMVEWEFKENCVDFEHQGGLGGLYLDVYFDGDSSEDEFVIIKKSIPSGIDINKYPCVEILFKIEDPSLQLFDISFGIDINEDGRADRYINEPCKKRFSAAEFEQCRINVYDIIKDHFPNKQEFKICEIEIYARKEMKKDCSRRKNKKLKFWVKSIRFLKLSLKYDLLSVL